MRYKYYAVYAIDAVPADGSLGLICADEEGEAGVCCKFYLPGCKRITLHNVQRLVQRENWLLQHTMDVMEVCQGMGLGPPQQLGWQPETALQFGKRLCTGICNKVAEAGRSYEQLKSELRSAPWPMPALHCRHADRPFPRHTSCSTSGKFVSYRISVLPRPCQRGHWL